MPGRPCGCCTQTIDPCAYSGGLAGFFADYTAEFQVTSGTAIDNLSCTPSPNCQTQLDAPLQTDYSATGGTSGGEAVRKNVAHTCCSGSCTCNYFNSANINCVSGAMRFNNIDVGWTASGVGCFLTGANIKRRSSYTFPNPVAIGVPYDMGTLTDATVDLDSIECKFSDDPTLTITFLPR